MSGPIPIMVMTLTATAPRNPIARCMLHDGSVVHVAYPLLTEERRGPAEKDRRNVGELPTSVHVRLTLTP